MVYTYRLIPIFIVYTVGGGGGEREPRGNDFK